MSFKPRAVLPATAFTLPSRYYTDSSIFEREMEIFYRGMWTCAGRVDDLASPGAYIVREIAGDQVILIRRGADADDVRAFHNVCRHRGTRLCAAEAGVLNGTIQCPYHAWTYDLDGRLIGAPHMEGTPGFRRDDYPLHAAAAAVWEGHLFVHVGVPDAPLSGHLAGLTVKFAPWRMRDLRRAHRIVYDVRANWKLIVQNYNECLHCPTLHPALNRLSHYLGGENEPLQRSYMGGRMDLNDGVDTMSIDGARRRACLPGLAPADQRRVYYYSIFPNLLLAPHPDYLMTHTLWPVASDRTRIVCEWHFHPDAMASADFEHADVTDFWDVTNRQDWGVCELAQSGIGSRAYRPGPYSSREDLLYAFDRFILQSLGDAE